MRAIGAAWDPLGGPGPTGSLPESVFAQTATKLIAEHGLTAVSVVEVDSPGSLARARYQAKQVRYEAGLRMAPPQAQRFLAAHEVGHLVLAHGARSAGVATAALSFNAFVVLVTVVTVVAPEVAGPPAAPAIIASFVALVAFRSKRVLPLERAADAWALDQVGPLSDADRTWLRAHEGRSVERPRPTGKGSWADRWPMWLRTHPRWAERGRDSVAGT